MLPIVKTDRLPIPGNIIDLEKTKDNNNNMFSYLN